MPSDEYKTAIGGGLKLKGSKPAGVNKSKKKKKSKEKTGDIDSAKLQNALAEEDRKAGEDGEGDTASGKQVRQDLAFSAVSQAVASWVG